MKLIAVVILFLAWSLAAQAELPPRPVPPKPRPLLLLSPFTGEKLVVRALVATLQEDVLSVEAEDGHKAGWNRTALVATLPWYTDVELASRGVNLPALAAEYDDAARGHPEFRAGLAAEMARVQTGMAALAQDRRAKLAAVSSFHYDPAIPYTPEELRRHVQAAEAAMAVAPEEQLSIAGAVAPLREHLAKLEAGQTYFEHQWRTPEEMRQLREHAAESARLNAYAAGLQIPSDIQIISADRVNAVLAVVGGAAGAAVLSGIVRVFRRRFLPGAVMILLPLLGVGYYVALLSSKAMAWPVVSDPSKAAAGSASVAKIVEAATKPLPSPDKRQLHVTEADLNDFLATHVMLQGSPAAGAINLQRIGIKLINGSAMICETADWRGHPVRIQSVYDVRRADGSIVVTDAGVWIGNAPVPAPVVGWLRAGLASSLGKFFAVHNPLANYTLMPVTGGSVDLLVNAPTPPASTTRVTPPTPIPEAGTPVSPTPALITPTPSATTSP